MPRDTGTKRGLSMRGIPVLACLFLGVLIPALWGQALQLDDGDLEGFDVDSARNKSVETADKEDTLSFGELEAVTARYDELIDQLKAQLRKVRIELRDLPGRVDAVRTRLKTMEETEEELRWRAFERVVYRWPQPLFEDFEAALEEALDRQAIQQKLILEIRANEEDVRELEDKRNELERDIEQALDLKEEAREAAMREP
jgi:hypothetical protein